MQRHIVIPVPASGGSSAEVRLRISPALDSRAQLIRRSWTDSERQTRAVVGSVKRRMMLELLLRAAHS